MRSLSAAITLIVLTLVACVSSAQNSTYSVLQNSDKQWITGSCYDSSNQPVLCTGRWIMGVGTQDPPAGMATSDGDLVWRSDTKSFRTRSSGVWGNYAGPNEIDCSEMIWGYAICDSPPVVSGIKRSVTAHEWVAAFNGDAGRQDYFTVGTAPGAGTPIFTANDSTLVIDQASTATSYLAVIGYIGSVLGSATGSNYSNNTRRTVTGVSVTTSDTENTGGHASSWMLGVGGYAYAPKTSGTVAGVTGGAMGSKHDNSTVGTMSGVTGSVDFYNGTTTIGVAASAGSFTGPTNPAKISATPAKVYKLYTEGYGRNYFMQPADATGDTQYSVEAVNGLGILASGRTGQLQLAKASGGAKPACAVGTRGSFWYEPGGAGVADTTEVCRKDAANNYAWVSVY